MKLVVIAVMTKLVLTAVMTKLVVTRVRPIIGIIGIGIGISVFF